MPTPSYKYCFVLSCFHSSKKHPEKYFFRVPYNKLLREKWCIAVGRNAESLKQSSTAFCCSDHFDLVEDLDSEDSAYGTPKLKKEAIPSLLHSNHLTRNTKAMQLFGIIGEEALNNEAANKQPSGNVYIREVVYIEENHDDRFLEENNEPEECLSDERKSEFKDSTPTTFVEYLSDERKSECKDSTPPTFVDISDHRVFLRSIPSKMFNEASIRNKIVDLYKQKESAASHEFNQKHTNQLRLADHEILEKINPKPKTVPVKYKLIKGRIQPTTTAVQKPLPIRIGEPITLKPNVVNKLKCTNFNEFNKVKVQQIVESSTTKCDDDDCILVEEQNMLNNNRAALPTNVVSSNRFLTTLPKSISVKVSKGTDVGSAQAKIPLKLTPVQLPIKISPFQHTKALVPVEPKVRVREFSKISSEPDVNQDKVYKLIRLMLSENQMLLANNKGNCIKIARTKPNEFKIFDTVYYYRTNDEYANNYFFLNITKNSRHQHEIIQRNYGIYWGEPRVSCVGIVETKGVLDEETKNFVFQQVKKSIFHEKGPKNVKLLNLNVAQPIKLVQQNSVPTKKIATVTRIINPATEASTIVKPKGDSMETILSKTMEKQCHTVTRIIKPATEASTIVKPKGDSMETILSKTMEKQWHKPISSTSIEKPILLDAWTRPVISKLTPETIASLTQLKTTYKHNTYKELIRLSNFLTPSRRNIINTLKYFKMYDGKIYTVNIGPNFPTKKRPYDIFFTEMKSGFNVQHVTKELYVSKLVNFLFKAIYAHLTDQSNKPIPIPTPQNLASQFTTEMMGTLVTNDCDASKKTQANLYPSSSLQQVKNLKPVKKHKCKCGAIFERKYQLKRHQFVRHCSDNPTSTIPTSDMEIKPFIKTEKSEETLPTDASLLSPLFEVPIKVENSEVVNCPGDYSLVKCKQEPDVDLEEEMAMPLATDNKSKQNARKRKAFTNAEDTESATECIETDSAPECSHTCSSIKCDRGKRTKIPKYSVLAAKAKREKLMENQKRQNASRKSKRSGSMVSSAAVVSDIDSVIPVKISEAKKFMIGWPRLTVDLVDVHSLIK